MTLAVADLGAQGDGIAFHEGQTLFVPGALATETVEALVRDGQRVELREVVTPSVDRVTPPCAHFPVCGGCRLQHLRLEAYQDWKFRQIETLLADEGVQVGQLLPTLTSPLGSRRRARVAAQNTRHKIEIGFNQWRSHELVNLTECSVLDPKLTALIQALREKLRCWLSVPKAVGDIQLTVLDDGIDVVLIGGGKLTLDLRQDLAALAEELDLAQLAWRKQDRAPLEPIAYRLPLKIRLGTTPVPFPPGSFLQATREGEAALISFAAKAVGDSAKVLDLFCGLGGFGLSMPKAASVTFADLDGPAIAALGQAVRQRPSYRVKQRDLMREPFMSLECDAFDAVIFDPPRGGAKAQTEQLAASKVQHIVAISCDPVSFVRDARILIAGGYKLHKVQPVDQFLWSSHLELAAHFTR